jgi:hypothetical protein
LCGGGDGAEIPSQEGRSMKGEPQAREALLAPADHTPSKSPRRKVVKFFAQRREQWKGKCRAAKASLKTLQKKRQRGEGRPQRWKSRVQTLAGERARLRAENRVLEAARAVGEKKERGERASPRAARRV